MQTSVLAADGRRPNAISPREPYRVQSTLADADRVMTQEEVLLRWSQRRALHRGRSPKWVLRGTSTALALLDNDKPTEGATKSLDVARAELIASVCESRLAFAERRPANPPRSGSGQSAAKPLFALSCFPNLKTARYEYAYLSP